MKQDYIKYYMICDIGFTKTIGKHPKFERNVLLPSHILFKKSKQEAALEFNKLFTIWNGNQHLLSLKVFEIKITKDNIENFFNDIVLCVNGNFNFKYYGMGYTLDEYSIDSSDLFKYFKTKKDITQEIKSNLIFT